MCIFNLISLPSQALDLMDQMLLLDPQKRITATEALKSEFLKDVNPNEIEPPK